MTTFAYLRISTNKQDLNNQKLAILEYARNHDLKVDEFLQISISSRRNRRDRRIDELLDRLSAGDCLIVAELSRLGRSTAEVILLVNELIQVGVRLIVLKQGLDFRRHDMQTKVMITLFSLFSELERDLISERTKEALAVKRAQGVLLGKPKGTIQESIYDKDRERIVELLGMGVPVAQIARRHLKYGTEGGLDYYVRTRELRE